MDMPHVDAAYRRQEAVISSSSVGRQVGCFAHAAVIVTAGTLLETVTAAAAATLAATCGHHLRHCACRLVRSHCAVGDVAAALPTAAMLLLGGGVQSQGRDGAGRCAVRAVVSCAKNCKGVRL